MKTSVIRGLAVLAVCVSLLPTGCSKSSPTGPAANLYGNTSNGNYTIILPTYMDSVLLGSAINVGWISDSSLIGTNAVISLYKGDNLVYTYGAYANPGSDTLPFTLSAVYAGSGSDYRWRISSALDSTKYDMSFYFRIYSAYSGTYVITSPTSDSVWHQNARYYFQWNFTGTPSPTSTIRLYDDTTLVSTFTTTVATGNGSYLVRLPLAIADGNRYRFLIEGTSDRGIFAYSSYFTVTPVAGDAFENDGSMDSARSITIGAVQGRTLTANDTDWIKFVAVSGTAYTLQTFGTTDTYMYLYSTDGTTLIASNDDGGTAPNNALINWTCAASGTYYIRVRGFNSINSVGDYSLSVTSP
jgi:hypothetical protein